jgi:O-antigen ligase
MLDSVIGLSLTVAVLIAFFKSLRSGVSTLILVRPLCDRVFESAKFGLAGHALTFGAIMNAVVLGAALVNLPRIRRQTPPVLYRIWLVFLLVAFVAVLYSPVRTDAFRKFLTYASFWAMFTFPFALVRSKDDVQYFLKLAVLSSLAPVLYGSFQLFSGEDWYLGRRIESTFSHPNIFAFYLVTTIGIALFLLATSRDRPGKDYRDLLRLYLVPLLVLLIMTKTRSAWICGLVLFLLYGVVYDKRVLIFALVLPLILVPSIPAVRERLVDLMSGNHYVGWVDKVNAFAWRSILWGDAFDWIRKRAFFGYGLYSFPYYSPQFFPLSTKGVDAHNVYVQLLFETGVAGLLSYVWVFWRSATWVGRFWKQDRRGIAMTVGIIGAYLISCWSDNLLEYVSFDWFFWFTIGLLYARFLPLQPSSNQWTRRTVIQVPLWSELEPLHVRKT